MSDSDTTPTPSPPTRQSATKAANNREQIRRRSRATVRARSVPRRQLTPGQRQRRQEIREQTIDEYPSSHRRTRRRKSCCERWFRWGSKKRNKKCKKKCKTRKKKRTKKRKRKKRTKKNA